MKKHFRKGIIFGVLALTLLLTACVSTQKRLLDSDTSQLQLRSIQTRAFDTVDREPKYIPKSVRRKAIAAVYALRETGKTDITEATDEFIKKYPPDR